MASTRKLPVGKIVGVIVTVVVLLGALLVSAVVAMKWVTISWTEKIPPGRTEAARRMLAPGDAVEEVHEVSKEYIEEALGTLKAATRTEIAARVLAPIQRLTVRAGQEVKEGEDLVLLDRRALETQRSRAEASLVSAQASLDKAENDYKRDVELVKKNVISRQQFDETTSRVKVARANLNLAKQALQEADVMLSYTVIKAPKSGVIVDRLAEEGDMAQPGVPLLILYDPTSLRLEVPVREDLAFGLEKGDQVDVRIDVMDKTIKATVDEIVPQAQAASRSLLVKLALPKLPGMYEGMFGRVLLPAGTRRHLCLSMDAIEQVGQFGKVDVERPDRFVERIGQLEMVDVVLPDGSLERRLIKTGRIGRHPDDKQPGRVEVLSGLEAGEIVRLRTAAAAGSAGGAALNGSGLEAE